MNESNPIKSPKFKIGDKVEVDTKKGTICHVSDFIGAYHVRTEKNGVILAYEENIKKLPKYAVGDVVRDKHDGKIYEVTMVLGSETYRSGDVCFLEGAVEPFDGFRVGDTVWTVKRGKGVVNGMATWNKKDTRSYVVFFDKHGYKYPKNTNIIPTEAKYKYLVEASKKPLVPSAEGWAKVADAFGKSLTAIEVAANLKKFSDVCKKFPSGGVVYQCPKVDPLIPRRLLWYTDFVEPRKKPTYTRTAPVHLELVDGYDGCEKKYRASKFAVGELVSYAGCIRAVVDAIHWKDGKFTYDLRTNSCPDGVPEDSLIAVPQPKFKEGDIVYYNGLPSLKKWRVVANDCGVCKLHGVGTIFTEITTANESDLRLWKETKLTEGLSSFDDKWVKADYQIDPSWTIKYIGNVVGKDTFVVTGISGIPALFRGIKGDDIS